ncbi:DUF5682 family protein [Actinocorallia sp. A-T 12471]|uniref:DUF5682 family protein n=1 Tax=Actinocorallia sp. A-T 12471 TaxID=3089813 RepID=UPI0029CF5B7B|nr:DUF5682 family protein [Actinocorallia sp. A-T 12471]MDX6739409.1 DUF5682 family protein [Actinocorallia sp. A-T 12471]
MSVEVYGVRHHGPGSARALDEALAAQRPDIVLIEGPPEADALIPLAADPGMVPPVALLAYTADAAAPTRAAFWPFAAFSPEWRALRHAVTSGVPARFIDLPAAHTLAEQAEDDEPSESPRHERPSAQHPRDDTQEPSSEEAAETQGRGSARQARETANETAERPRQGAAQQTSEGAAEEAAWTLEGYAAERDSEGPEGDAARNAAPKPEAGAVWQGSGEAAEEEKEREGLEGDAARDAAQKREQGAARQGSDEAEGAARQALEGEAREGSGEAEERQVLEGAEREGLGEAEGAGAREGLEGEGLEEGVGWWGRVRRDPLGVLAEVAGYADAERWWDDVIELRGGADRFAAVAEAMAVLREGDEGAPSVREERREAAMRQGIRKALKEGYSNVAVVCGAWHVPALSDAGRARVTVAKDTAALRGVPKVKVAVTWVPWTHGRLTRDSGYGAGVSSPGWYGHLFEAEDRPVERWLTEAARVLRDEGLPVSSGHVIEAVRLAEALAALRGRPLPGLEELTEAVRAVLCEGAELPVTLVERRLVVGERLGRVPPETPMVPLQRDLEAARRRLRLKASADKKEHVFDLRNETDLARSRLLHRLRLLDVGWGEPAGVERGKGTFKETWTLLWRPEFGVRLIEAGGWGTTVVGAANARVTAQVSPPETPELPELTALAERCLLADLSAALPRVMRALADRAAADRDAANLMAALPPLVRSLRYGDVRGTATGPLRAVVDGLVVRFCVGLPAALSALDDDAAREALGLVGTVHESLALLDDPAHTERWLAALESLSEAPTLHGVLAGRLTRLLMDAGRITDLADRMSRAVSAAAPPDRAAAWVEGFLSDGALVLLHDEDLLALLDSWLAALSPAAFDAALPLLRRTFARFASPERRALATAVRRPAAARGARTGPEIDVARAAPAVATVLAFLDVRTPSP